ncbi:MAG: Dabb family protein [Limisphaerales bacterium]
MKNCFLMLGFVLALGLLVPGAAAKDSAKKGKLRHVVAFKFKDGTTAEQIKQVEDAFRELKTKISEIKAYEWGVNVSPEKRNKGFTHGFIVTFKNEKDRDAYLVHPAHKEFGTLVGPLLDDVFVIDFWAKH